jgi:hypothetical protein
MQANFYFTVDPEFFDTYVGLCQSVLGCVCGRFFYVLVSCAFQSEKYLPAARCSNNFAMLIVKNSFKDDLRPWLIAGLTLATTSKAISVKDTLLKVGYRERMKSPMPGLRQHQCGSAVLLMMSLARKRKPIAVSIIFMPK